MTYKEAITKQCTEYAKNPKARFIGYNTAYGSRMYGTLANVPKSQCIETPVAENLMMGLAMGMSLEGYRPVVCFERHDFLLIALDAIVNHLDKMPYLSGDQFKFPVIVRAIAGGSRPLDAGVQHTNNYHAALLTLVKHTLVIKPESGKDLKSAWKAAGITASGAVIIIERRDWYDEQVD